MQKSKIYFLTSLFFLFTIHYLQFTNLYAGEAILSWDSNTEEDLSGYKVYWGIASTSYTQVTDVGLTDYPDSPLYTVTDLDEGNTYYFAVTAYDTSENESEYSEEVYKEIKVSDSSGSQDSSKTEDANNDTSSNDGDNTPQSDGEDSSSATSTITGAQTGSSGCGITANTDNNKILNIVLLFLLVGLIMRRRLKSDP